MVSRSIYLSTFSNWILHLMPVSFLPIVAAKQYIVQQKCQKEELNRKSLTPTLSATISLAFVTDIQTDGQTDESIMPISDHTCMQQYDRLKSLLAYCCLLLDVMMHCNKLLSLKPWTPVGMAGGILELLILLQKATQTLHCLMTFSPGNLHEYPRKRYNVASGWLHETLCTKQNA